MDEASEKKFFKCKYKVKKWECDFKKNNGRNPSKADIKGAPLEIKDSYKTYWKLRTLSLETSLLDLSFGDEDSLDSYTSFPVENVNDNSQQSSATDNRGVSGERKDEEHVQEEEVKLTSKPLDTHNEEIQTDNENHIVVKDRHNSSVWGSHLSNVTKKVEDKAKPDKNDISFRYTAKLLPGATFNKRNPRKALIRREKSVDLSVLKPRDTLVAITSDVSQICSKREAQSSVNVGLTTIDVEDCKAEGNFDSYLTYKVINNLKLSKPSQPVNYFQTKLSSNTTTIPFGSRAVDKGWLDRLDKATKTELPRMNSSDSGIDVTESTVLEPRPSPPSTSQCDLNSNDEDLVCDSGSEDERTKSFVNSNFKNSFSLSTLPNRITRDNKQANCSLISLTTVKENKPEQKTLKRLRDSEPEFKEGELIDELKSKPNKRLKIDTLVPHETHDKPENKYLDMHKSSVRGISDQSEDPEHIHVDNKKRPLTYKEIKLKHILESKMSSGIANENFVKINIKKKTYVRGKKTMTFQKYKKQKWKEMKKNQNTNERGIMKCFKCGDVGHFARNCNKGCDQLLPVEDLDEVEESPFPTLQEAEEMAIQASKMICVKRNIVSIPVHVTNENMVTGESTPLSMIDTDDIMRFVKLDPIFQLNEDGSLIDTPLMVLKTLVECGHNSFRPGQETAVMRILSGLSTLVTLSTGSGKSLCYQLPAYLYHMLQQRITIVVSPLVSLMEDQVIGVAPCLQVACLHTGQTPQVRASVYEKLRANSLHVLLVSPEALAEAERMGELLRSMPPVAFACIDEAHCISQWSHNFRPSYLTICQVLREKFGVKTFLGLTATATKATIRSITAALGLPDGCDGVISNTPLPSNLMLTVSRDPCKDQAVIRLLQGKRFFRCRSIIIYCTRREECQRLAAFIRTRLQDESREDGKIKRGKISWNAEVYHAGLTAARRKSVQKAFMSGQTRIVVATVAFGMGINKQDIQGIIHYNMPNAFERYVQEVGRAGRDGAIAHCHVFLDTDGKDLSELRRHVYADSVERHTVRKLLHRVFVACQCGHECPGHEVALPLDETVKALDLSEEHICTLLCYLQLDRHGWLRLCPRAYTRCRVLCYKGASCLRLAVKECPPLAVAIAQHTETGVDMKPLTSLDFSVFTVATAIKWDSGVVKQQLKNLEWTKVDGKPRRSGLTVELYELGLRLLAPGNLSSEELDCALDTLTSRVEAQETQALLQLQAIFDVLMRASYKTVDQCIDEVDADRCEALKDLVRQYFTEDSFLDGYQLPEVSLANEDQVASSVRALVNSYRDVTFTGRAVARIFHGISSPNFPALQWSRCRQWRAHLHEDFKMICHLATRELIKMR